MSEFDDQSRMNKFDKRRKNTRNISIFLIIGAVLLVVLIALFIFGGNDKADKQTGTDAPNSAETPSEHTDNNESRESASQSNDNSDKDNTEKEQTNDESGNKDEEKDIESLESDDSLVIEAYTKHWEPVGTQQSGPHTVVYDDGSQDRKEMEKAIETATGLSAQDTSYLWLANNGDQKVLATFSDSKQEDHYRVYLSWVNSKGWQPTRVEILKENDQMYRFE